MGYMPGTGPGLCEEVLPEGSPVLGDSLQDVGLEWAGIHMGYMPGPGPGLCEGVLPEGSPVLGDSL
jgi:hypothetical protein